MGHRANLLLVRHHTYDLYYSHWCANTLPASLFWGAQYAVQYIEMQSRDGGWLDDVWAEGGAVVDLTKRKLLLFGGEDLAYDYPLRQLYLELMNHTWTGWDIEWAYEGIVDLASYVSYPRENVLVNRRRAGAGSEAGNAVASGTASIVQLDPPRDRSWLESVASIRFKDDEVLLYPLEGSIEEYLLHGTALLERIERARGYERLDLKEWSEHFPIGGFHLDLAGQELTYWHTKDCPNLSRELASAWVGWNVSRSGEGYAAQERLTQGKLLFQSIDRQALLEELRSMLLCEHANPANSLAMFLGREAAAGKQLEVNPHALTYNAYEIPRAIREQILNEAIASLKGAGK